MLLAALRWLWVALVQVPVITAVYAGSPELPAAVEAAIRAQQNNDTSVALGLAAAKILEKVRPFTAENAGMHADDNSF